MGAHQTSIWRDTSPCINPVYDRGTDRIVQVCFLFGNARDECTDTERSSTQHPENLGSPKAQAVCKLIQNTDIAHRCLAVKIRKCDEESVVSVIGPSIKLESTSMWIGPSSCASPEQCECSCRISFHAFTLGCKLGVQSDGIAKS